MAAQPKIDRLRDNYLPEILTHLDKDGNPLPEESCSVDCAICREPLAIFQREDDSNHAWACLPCGHLFGYDCIQTWFRSTFPYPACPSCRKHMIHNRCRHMWRAHKLPSSDGFNIRTLLPASNKVPQLCERCDPTNVHFDPANAHPLPAPLQRVNRHANSHIPIAPVQSRGADGTIVFNQLQFELQDQNPGYRTFLYNPEPSSVSRVNPAAQNQNPPAPNGPIGRTTSPPQFDNSSAYPRYNPSHGIALQPIDEMEFAIRMREQEQNNRMAQAQPGYMDWRNSHIGPFNHLIDHRARTTQPLANPSLRSYTPGDPIPNLRSRGESNEQPGSESPAQSPHSPKDDETTGPGQGSTENTRESFLAQRQFRFEEAAHGPNRDRGQHPIHPEWHPQNELLRQEVRRQDNERNAIQLAYLARVQTRMNELRETRLREENNRRALDRLHQARLAATAHYSNVYPREQL
ncbi:hypothetical protein F5X99DRAFT_371699 [Biscogniauxia marginata]|nr:hypothetical protein F5X99DRAFT_371699 [Biscogniauxia marginata]